MAAAAALEAAAPTDTLWGLVHDFVMGQQEGPADQVAAGTADGSARLPHGGQQEGAASALEPGGKGGVRVTLRDWSQGWLVGEHHELQNRNKRILSADAPVAWHPGSGGLPRALTGWNEEEARSRTMGNWRYSAEGFVDPRARES
ncbi:hypothetical protein P7K49_024201 [Saguinus oedipus]|uniref:Uncharacterized protein n=1 Tax=Saguinus oedipus TaxID=9490 RepID=A0ABQ9UNV4_SAGOE|nr:hypothetical protein P7K49_024201 [Saguinus oedipus]